LEFLPLIGKDKIVLIRQFRFPINKEIWEIPAGKLHRDEKPELGARRELKEETGYEAKELKKIGEFYFKPWLFNRIYVLIFSKEVKKGRTRFR
jgi:ADP-ribose pyrophosphatase